MLWLRFCASSSTIGKGFVSSGLAINILPALRFFKIKVNFKFKKNDEE
jgi:hypothetical protein